MYSVYKIILSLYVVTLVFCDWLFFLMQYDCFNVLVTLVHIRIDNSAKPRHNIYILTKPFSLLQREFSFQHYQIPQVQMYNISVMQYDLTCILSVRS